MFGRDLNSRGMETCRGSIPPLRRRPDLRMGGPCALGHADHHDARHPPTTPPSRAPCPHSASAQRRLSERQLPLLQTRGALAHLRQGRTHLLRKAWSTLFDLRAPSILHGKTWSTLLDLCVSSLRRGHANLLCIVPILTDDPRRESEMGARARRQRRPKPWPLSREARATDKQTDRQTDRQTKQTDSQQAETQTDRRTHRRTLWSQLLRFGVAQTIARLRLSHWSARWSALATCTRHGPCG